jgi:hypothetical protein
VEEKSVERSTLQPHYKKSREWAEHKLAELQQEWVDKEDVDQTVSGVIVSSLDLADVNGPDIMSNMDDIVSDNSNIRCNDVYPFDYHVVNLFEGVHKDRHSTGQGAQLLTRVIGHTRNTGNSDLRMSQVSSYSQQYGITVPHEYWLFCDLADEYEAGLEWNKTTID